MAKELDLLLASASPRRRDLLASLGLRFEVRAVEANESALSGERAGAYLTRVVEAKMTLAREVAMARGARAVLVADTTVVLEGAMLAKPASPEENVAMVRSLAGRKHRVMTRFAVERLPGKHDAAGVSAVNSWAETVTTSVRFRALSADEIKGYVATGEGLDKAGGYAIQGVGGFMVESIEGSYSNVVGLPVCEVVRALVRTGVIERFPVVGAG